MSSTTHRPTADDIADKLISMLLHDLIVDSAARVRLGDLSGARHDLARAIETIDILESSPPIPTHTPIIP